MRNSPRKERARLVLDSNGFATRERLVAYDMGNTLLMLNLERACRVQLAIQSSGQPVTPVSPEVCEKTALQYASGDSSRLPGQPDPNLREWRALLQRLQPGAAASFRD